MESFLKEFEHLKINLDDIKSATNNFGANKVIGAGGFGNVYLGEVPHSEGESMGAFKRLDPRHGQGDPEFWKEIMMLSGYKHGNLISLLGFCNQGGERILVYEYASNGSLDRHLSSTHLTWRQRIKICLDAARGLSYLHNDRGTMQRIIHRDIKSSNILLDDNWNAKVSDMGLSKIGPANQAHSFVITQLAGTPGYCDPQYMKSYTLTKESDVYSFGVVLFEVLCGRLCYKYNDSQVDILVPAWKKAYKEKKLHEIVFQGPKQPMDPISLEIFSGIAFQCLQKYREKRPTIAYVVEKLESALEFQKPPRMSEDGFKELVSSLKYRFEIPLPNGVFLNGGETWFSVNEYGEHCEMISIAACLVPDEVDSSICGQHSNHESRFTSGTYKTRGQRFKTRVRTKCLSPLVRYTVNLVFKCHKKLEEIAMKQQHISISYQLEGMSGQRSIVYLDDKREDQWLIAKLHSFFSCHSVKDLEIVFESHPLIELEIEGIEFQPEENSGWSRANNDTKINVLKFKMPLHYVMAATLAMDESILDADHIENLIEFYPTENQMLVLKDFRSNQEMLGTCNQVYLELMKVPRMKSKLRVFLFKIKFNTQVSEFKKLLNTVVNVKSSDKLREIMKTISYLGDTLNEGTARRSALVGFKLDSFLKFTDTRASNSEATSMHYLCKVLASKSPALLDFHVDLVSLEPATKIEIVSIAKGMQEISNGLQEVKEELDASANDGPVSEVFRKTLNKFFGSVESDVRTLISLYTDVGRKVDALSYYFGENPVRCPFEYVTKTLFNFVRVFRNAHEENCLQAELETREKAQKEIEMEMTKAINHTKKGEE